MSNHIINGIISNKEDLLINDRGFLYGDGFFETMFYENSRIQFIADHLKRIQSACEVAEIDFPEELDANQITQLVKDLCNVEKLENAARVKLIIWRKEGGRFTPDKNSSNYMLQVTNFSKAPEIKSNVAVSKKVKNCNTAISQFKTLSCMQYILVGIEMKKRNVDDLIILDVDDNISECSSSNIFWVKENQIYTPDKSTGCIEGIQKNNLLNLFYQNNFEVAIGKFSLSDLLKADLVFTSNVTGISKIEQVENTYFDKSINVKLKFPFLYTATGALICG